MIKMPWNETSAPNIMLEVTDACNINCAVCYKRKGKRFKQIDEILAELDQAMRIRKLHTVTLSGGEPLLHPDLCEIIRRIKLLHFHVFLLTNGVLLTEARMHALKAAGLDSILFHVDPGQERPDLDDACDFNDVLPRLRQLIGWAHAEGVDVSMSVTLMDNGIGALDPVCRFFFDTPELTFLFLAKGTDLESFYHRGDGQPRPDPGEANGGGRYDLNGIMDYFRDAFGIDPFSYIPGKHHNPTVWISYFVPIVYGKNASRIYRIVPTRADAWLMELPRKISGRYIHKTTQKPAITLLRTVINGLARFEPLRLSRFLIRALKPTTRLRHKMIVYDHGPYFNAAGDLIHCEYCPTAIMRNGSPIPCCVADYQPAVEIGAP